MRGWVLLLTACSFSPPAVGGDEDSPTIRLADAPPIADGVLVDGRPDAPSTIDASGSADGGCAPRAIVDACDGIVDLGSVSGDTGEEVITAHGRTSASFTVEVREDNSTPVGSNPLAQIELDSPDDADFDLRVFCFGACGGSPIATSDHPSGELDSVGVGQEDHPGEDNGFHLWVDVRFYDGSNCGDWKLTVRGNRATNPVSCY